MIDRSIERKRCNLSGVVRRAVVVLVAVMGLTAMPAKNRSSLAMAAPADAAETKVDSLTTPADMAAAKRLIDAYKKTPPFSFKYDGASSADLLLKWDPQTDVKQLDASRTQQTMTWTERDSGITVRLVSVTYSDFPAVEWTAYIRNAGAKDSKTIDDLRAMDAMLGTTRGGEITVHSQKGSEAADSDYLEIPIKVAANGSTKLASKGGRGSDGMAMPYFNFEMPGAGGACLAIGWPGQWDATFSRAGDDLRVSAGQEQVHTILHPGEEMRTPLIAIVAYAGDDGLPGVQRGQNVWRRWMIAHNIPRVDGKMVGPFLTANSSHQFGEMIHANEQNQKQFVDAYFRRGINIDYWWMDAGWYENIGRWENTGTWKVDAKRFPRGLRAIVDVAQSKGAKAIVWFEPERVTPRTELYDEHPDFLLSRSSGLRLLTPPGVTEPNMGVNMSSVPFTSGEINWGPKQASMHPGPKGEFSVARFAAPEAGTYSVNVKFSQGDRRATTDVHVIHRNKSLLDATLNPGGDTSKSYSGELELKRGEVITFAVGYGANNDYTCDTTLVDVTINAPHDKTYELSKELLGDSTSAADNAKDAAVRSPWTLGAMPKGDLTRATPFIAYARGAENPVDPSTWKLLNLGNPEARKWITDRVDSIIKSQAIGVYRQDFNIEPLDFWRGADTPDRQGMTENLYVQGYLAYWDALLERNPAIYIDSCASGGRRNDLETLRRSVPFLRSDRLFYPIGQQSQSFGINQWMPLNGSPTIVGKSEIFGETYGDKISAYVFRSDVAPIVNLCADILDEKLDYDTYRKLVNEWRAMGPAYLGDFYKLTESSLDADKWMAWEFYLPNTGSGFIQAFRREKAGDASRKLKLHGLDRTASYDVVDSDHADRTKTVSGAALMDDGLDITIDEQPGAVVIWLKRK